jgi:hypothetical protein
VCKGYCCLDELYYPIEHMGAGWYRHDCCACVHGTKYEPARSVGEERADVLAFLEQACGYAYPDPPLHPSRYIKMLATLITTGSHIGAVKRGEP